MKKSLSLLSLVAILVGSLSGCSGSSGQQPLVAGSALAIGESGALTSLNSQVLASPASTRAALDLAELTLPAFYQHQADGSLKANTDFGTVKEISAQDFSYTLTGKAKWNDGQPVSVADLAASWLAATDTETPGFGSALRLTSLSLADKISITDKTIKLHFSKPIPDWQTALPLSVPAHLLGKLALPYSGLGEVDAAQLVQDVATGVNQSNRAALATAFAGAFALPADGSKIDPSLTFSAGAYRIKSATASKVVLQANKDYSVGSKAAVETIILTCYSSADDLNAAIAKRQVDLASPVATSLGTMAVQEQKAQAAGFSTNAGGSVSNEVVLLNHGTGSAFNASYWSGNQKQAAAAAQAFFKFLPRAGIWKDSAGDSSIKPTDSFVFAKADAEYDASTHQNGSTAYQFQDAEASAEQWQSAKFDRTIKLRVLFDSANPRGQLEYTQLSRLGKLGGFDLENISTDNPAAVLASGQWDVYITELGRMNASAVGLAATVGVITGFDSKAAAQIVARSLPTEDGKFPIAADAVTAKNLDQTLVQEHFGLPLFELSRLVIWSGKLANYQPAPGNNSVVWGYSNWSVSGKGK